MTNRLKNIALLTAVGVSFLVFLGCLFVLVNGKL